MKVPRVSSATVFAFLLAASLGLNLTLHRVIQKQSNRLDSLAEQVNSTPLYGLAPGDEAPPLRVKDVKGAPATITTSERTVSTVLYIFTPQCSWCTRNLDNLRTLAERSPSQFLLFGISLRTQELGPYIANNRLTFPIFVEPDKETRTKYGLGATPPTIVIDKYGRVDRVWRGAYGANTVPEIEEYFNVQLPGLRDASSLRVPTP